MSDDLIGFDVQSSRPPDVEPWMNNSYSSTLPIPSYSHEAGRSTLSSSSQSTSLFVHCASEWYSKCRSIECLNVDHLENDTDIIKARSDYREGRREGRRIVSDAAGSADRADISKGACDSLDPLMQTAKYFLRGKFFMADIGSCRKLAREIYSSRDMKIPHDAYSLRTGLKFNYQDFPAFFNDLQAVASKYDTRINKSFLVVTTPEIILRDENRESHWLGTYEIFIDMYNPDWPVTVRSTIGMHHSSHEAHSHPHIQDGVLCWGDAMPYRRKYRDARMPLEYVENIMSFLNTYSRSGSYCELETWDGTLCKGCGISTTEPVECSRCEVKSCSDCLCSCCCCEESFCDECTYTCNTCDTNVCTSCSRTCDKCGECCCYKCMKDCYFCNMCYCGDCYDAELQIASGHDDTDRMCCEICNAYLVSLRHQVQFALQESKGMPGLSRAAFSRIGRYVFNDDPGTIAMKK